MKRQRMSIAPQREKIHAIVEGAVLNVAIAHNVNLPDYFANSVAKRAAGTLWSQSDQVLATVRPRSPNRGKKRSGMAPSSPHSQSVSNCNRGIAIDGQILHTNKSVAAGTGMATVFQFRPGQLRKLRNALGARIALAKRAGDKTRMSGFIGLRRAIDEALETRDKSYLESVAEAFSLVTAIHAGKSGHRALLPGERDEDFETGNRRKKRKQAAETFRLQQENDHAV